MVRNARDSKSKLRACWAAAAILLVIGLGACGGADQNATVVRVGDNAISEATVDHWTSVVRRGGAFTGFHGEPRAGTPRQRALALLISCNGLIGEAARRGFPVSEKVADQVLAERMQGEGAAELRKRLEATGQTVADVKLEIRAELAREAIREDLGRRADQIMPSEVAAFYRMNLGQFGTLETRVVDIIVNLPSPAAATALVRQIGTGRRFAKLAYHKEIRLTPGVLQGPATKKEVDRAIFAARPGAVSRPMSYNSGWTVFVVRKVIPAQPEPLAKVHDTVVASFKAYRKREVTRAVESEYKRRWIDRTSCHSGYVAPGCAEYHGPLGEYEDPFIED